MKELFIVWIMLQLVIVGVLGNDIRNRTIQGTFDCKKERKVYPIVVGIIFPLIHFSNIRYQVTDYCHDK